MDLIFKEVDKSNWEACTALSVSNEQKHFVASNWYSILQAKFEADLYPLCIYDGNTMVGFLMYGLDPDTNRMEMCRLMIGEMYQGKGYGKRAIMMLLGIIKDKYGNIPFYTSIEPDNEVAQKVYESLGFRKTGEIMWGEEVLVIKL